MTDGGQIRIGETPQPTRSRPGFLTDAEIDRRLSQVENGLAHIEAITPAMRREVAFLRGQLGPRPAG